MDIWKRLYALLLALCALLGATGAAAEANAGGARAPETTTLMLYMVGADLESKGAAATRDLQEIERCGVDLEAVNVLVCTGGAENWHNGLSSPEALTLLALTGSGFERLETAPLQSMGDPDCLTWFVNTCVERFPADHYGLVLWDHGNGPVIGYGVDALFGEDALTLSEMRQAMEQTPFTGGRRLDWVGFDACLMGSAELACVWGEHAELLLCSQETEPGFGWDYSFLSGCGRTAPRELLCAAADAYMDYAKDYFARKGDYEPEVTLSVLDLSRADALQAAVEALFNRAAGDVSGDYVPLARARVDNRAVGRASSNFDYDLVDLAAIAEKMAARYPKEAADLLDVQRSMVVHAVSNTPECCGMSLFYPYFNKNYYRSAWKDAYRALAVFPGYLEYLERYEKIWLGTDMKKLFPQELTLEDGAVPATYKLQLTPEQAEVYAAGAYTILRRYGEGLYAPIYSSGDVALKDGKVIASFDGRIIYCETDFQKIVPALTRWGTTEGITDYTVRHVLLGRLPDLVRGQTLAAEIRLSAEEETGEVQIKGVFGSQEGASAGKREPLDLSQWEVMRFYHPRPRYLVRDEDGRIPFIDDWPECSFIVSEDISLADRPRFTYEPLYDDGNEYFMLITIMDAQGNLYSSELFPIRPTPAPAEETAPISTAVWDGGRSVTLLEREGVSVTLRAAADGGAPLYALELENRSEIPVTITIDGREAVVNGVLAGCDWGTPRLWTVLEPGGTSWMTLDELSQEVLYTEEGRLTSLECTCRITRRDDGATLCAGRIAVEIPREPDFSLQWDEALTAHVQDQQLLDADGIRVTLLDLGVPVDADYLRGEGKLRCALCIENHSGAEKLVELDGLLINGVSITGYERILLGDGQEWFPRAGYSLDQIRTQRPFSMFFSSNDTALLPTITTIAGCSVYVAIDGRQYLCPVALPERDAALYPDGDLVYQDDAMEVWYRGGALVTDDLYGGIFIRYFWIVNRSEGTQSPAFEPCGDDAQAVFSISFDYIPPGGAALYSVCDSSGGSLSFITEDLFSDYRSGTIALPAVRR